MLQNKPLCRLFALSIGHSSVDAYAGMIGPLMIVFVTAGAFTEGSAKLLPAVMAIASSVTQPVVGLLGDRGVPKALFLAGPTFAAAAIGAALLTDQAALIVALLVISGLGIAIYHPEGATLASTSLERRSSLAISIFLFSGTVGLWLGPVICGWLIDHVSIRLAAALLAAPGVLLGLALAAIAIRGRDASPAGSPALHMDAAVPSQEEVRTLLRRVNWPLASLTAQATLRAMVMGAVGVVLPWWGERHGLSLTQIGHLSGLFLFSGGVGMLLMGWLSTPRREVPLLVATAAAGLVPIGLLGLAESFWLAAGCVAVGGLLVNGVGAMIVSMAQRAAPRGARTASALTMGFAWGLGAAIGPLIVSWTGNDTLALWICTTALLPAGALAMMMPAAAPQASPAPALPVQVEGE